MRGLAEYAMHGRRQAIIIVLLCGFLPLVEFIGETIVGPIAYFLSAAIVGLVNLRKETNEGFIILLWALLPAGLLLWSDGGISPLVLILSLGGLSQILKRSDSWQVVIFLASGLGVLNQLSLKWRPGYVAEVERLVAQTVAIQTEQGAPVMYTATQLVELLLGSYGVYHAIAIIMSLMLARWWQAALYNPGGFQQEFHQLHFDSRLMLPLMGLIFIGLMSIAPFNAWLTVFCLPPMISGMALLHYIVARKEMGRGWLILGYLALLIVAPVIIVIGLLDSVFDIRKRIIT